MQRDIHRAPPARKSLTRCESCCRPLHPKPSPGRNAKNASTTTAFVAATYATLEPCRRFRGCAPPEGTAQMRPQCPDGSVLSGADLARRRIPGVRLAGDGGPPGRALDLVRPLFGKGEDPGLRTLSPAARPFDDLPLPVATRALHAEPLHGLDHLRAHAPHPLFSFRLAAPSPALRQPVLRQGRRSTPHHSFSSSPSIRQTLHLPVRSANLRLPARSGISRLLSPALSGDLPREPAVVQVRSSIVRTAARPLPAVSP